MLVTFRCGHSQTVPATIAAAPTCVTCRERIIARVNGAQPHFTGTCSGPFCETKALDPAVVSVAPGGVLRLKSSKD